MEWNAPPRFRFAPFLSAESRDGRGCSTSKRQLFEDVPAALSEKHVIFR
jgi:hypothetical protein